MGFTPSAGEEIQSEYFVGSEHAVDAIHAIRRVRPAIAGALQISEIRMIEGDDLWLSPHYRRDSVAFHFTWNLDPAAANASAKIVEAALKPFAPRPHWGKVFSVSPADLASQYERLPDFRSLASRLDPRGAFVNPWMRQNGIQTE